MAFKRCFRIIKGTKSESKSQLGKDRRSRGVCCFRIIKGTKSESKSQHRRFSSDLSRVVSVLSKVQNLKANHNTLEVDEGDTLVVSILSKVQNLKANHN